MEWLTINQIIEAAEQGDLEALDASILHWRQILESTPKELLEAVRRNRVSPTTSHCALCMRYLKRQGYCDGCPLKYYFGDCAPPSFEKTENNWRDASDGFDMKYMGGSCDSANRKIQKLIDQLEEVKMLMMQ